MRILYILTTLGIGGAEKQVISLAEKMAARGHSVSLLTLKHVEEEWPTSLPVLRLNLSKTPIGIWRGLRFARSFFITVRPDLLHSHTFPAILFARMLRVLLRSEASPPIVINTIHNVYEGAWHRMMLYRLTDPWSDGVTAVSNAAAERFIHIGAVPAKKMNVLTNGIDAEIFAPNTRTRRHTRAHMQAGLQFVWLAVGRVVPAKDYPNLLRAFASVHESEPQTALWIIGDGDTDLVSQLSQSLVEGDSNTIMLGLRRDVRELLDAADGFVLSSAWEGMPLAVGEAMAMAKAVVATDVGGVRELVADAGTVVPPKDYAALAEAMLAIMRLPDKQRIALGQAARDRILTHFSLQSRVAAWEAFYTEWMNG